MIQMTREEFKDTVKRIFKDMSTEVTNETWCKGIYCSDGTCPFRGDKFCIIDETSADKLFNTFEFVEQWAKEHPVLTNADKFKEVWGCELTPTLGCLPCPKRYGFTGCRYSNMADTLISEDICNECTNAFWSAEYKAPKKEDNTDE